MKDIELKPSYTMVNIPGKCLAEQEYGDCLRELLKGGEGKNELKKRFEAMTSLLKSPDLARLRDQCEKHLADGKEVSLAIHDDDDNPRYEIRISDTDENT